VINHAAVDREPSVDDKNLNIWWDGIICHWLVYFLQVWIRGWGEPFMPPIAKAQVAYQFVKKPSIISCNL
jgi:hypothetical protein